MRAFQSNHIRAALICLAAFLLGVTPSHANGTDQLAGRSCVMAADDARARSAGEEAGAPANLSPDFYKRAVTLFVSADGLERRQLPISIKAVCGVHGKLAKEAAGLVGSDAVVLRLHRTTVWEGPALKIGPAATSLVNGADAALVRGRFVRPGTWLKGEDGCRIATFRAGRITVTD
jgi:hypothetical protein